jgi:hypothetical protein
MPRRRDFASAAAAAAGAHGLLEMAETIRKDRVRRPGLLPGFAPVPMPAATIRCGARLGMSLVGQVI